MKILYVTALPYATQEGTLEVPDDLEEKDYTDYVWSHFGDVNFSEVNLDYAGTDLEISD
jgi:hypothetical protein